MISEWRIGVMKDYAIGLVAVKWSRGRIVLLVILAVLSLLIQKYISANPYLPLWLDGFGPFFAAAVDGPVFGAAVSALWLILSIAVNGFSVHSFLLILMFAIMAAIFGAMFRLGFFGNKKTVPFAFAVLILVDTLTAVATSMALYGESTFTNIITTLIHGLMTSLGVHGLIAGTVSYMAASIVDKAIIIAVIFLIFKVMPQKIADFFAINKKIPVAVFVKTKEDGEFQDEKDKLMQNAQEKIEQKKSAEAVK